MTEKELRKLRRQDLLQLLILQGREVSEQTDKIRELRAICDQVHPECDIEVDGGITLENVEDILSAGANVIVAGSSVFRGDAAAHVKAYKEIFANHG